MSDDLFRIQSGDGSKFNSSLADLERMHNLLVLANQACIVGDLMTWLNSLQTLDREISPYLNEKEDEELESVRVYGFPTDVKASSIAKRKLGVYERKLRFYRSKKKLGIVAEDDASSAAMR